MQDTALPWLVLQRANSPTAVGLLIFCRYVPFTLLGLYAGVLADRFDNRRSLIATQFGQMAIAGALAALAWSGGGPLFAIYLLATLSGAVAVFDFPNRQALTYQLVGPDELPNAIALNSSLQNAGRIVGPATAGAIIAVAGVATCFAVNAVTFLAVLAVLMLMRASELYPVERAAVPVRGFAGLTEGLVYVLHQRRMALLIGLAAVFSLGGFSFRVLVPVLASSTLHSGPEVFGVLYACFGLGAMSGGLVAAGMRPQWRWVFLGMGGMSVALILLAPVRSTVPAAVLLFAIGVGFTLWSANTQTMLQLAAPGPLRGRVLALFILVFAGFQPIGSLLAGWLASVGGTTTAFLVAGLSGLLATVLASLYVRRRRLLRPAPLGRVVTPVEEPPV